MSGDLNFKISAEIAELKKAIADAKRELAGLGNSAGKKGVDGLNASLDATAEAAAEAARAAKAASDKQAAAIKAQAAEIRKLREEYDKLRKQQGTPPPRTPAPPAPAPAPRAPATQRGGPNVAAQVAPQLTDIGVSLASGQNPLLVLLQQGGQLKDMFGGIVPAVRAVGTAIGAMITPVTLAVAAIGALGLAFLKGSEEANKLNRALLETGNSVGLSGTALAKFSQQLAQQTGGTQSGVVATLEAIIRSGKIAGDQVKLVAEVAETLKAKTGRDVEATIADFAKIGDDPVKGARELNKQYNFLTGSTLAQVRALQQQGRSQEATKLVAEAYANTLKDRTPEIQKNLGLIERGWLKAKQATLGAFDALLEIGRPDTSKDIQDKIDRLQQRLQGPSGSRSLANNRAGTRARIAALEAEKAELLKKEAEEAEKANKERAKNRAVELQGDLADEAQQYETAAQRRIRLREQIANRTASGLANAATAGEEAAAKEISASRDKILQGLDREAARSNAAIAQVKANGIRDDVERSITEIDRLYAQGEVSLERYLERKKELQLKAIDAELQAARIERGAAAEPEEIAQANGRIAQLQRQRANVEKEIAFERATNEREVNSQVIELRAQALEEQGRLEEAFALRFEEQYRTLRKRLVAEQNSAGVALLDQIRAAQTNAIKQQTADQVVELKARQLENEGKLEEAFLLRVEGQYRDLRKRLANDPEGLAVIDNLVNADRAKAKFDEIRANFDRVVAELRSKQDAAQIAIATGAVSPEAGNAQEQAARTAAIAQLQAINAEMQKLAASTNDPAIKQGATDIANALGQIGVESATGLDQAIQSLNLSLAEMGRNLASSAVNAGVDALEGLFMDLVEGSKSADEALKDFVVGFVRSMAQIAARAMATYLVLQLLNAIPGGAAVTAAIGFGAGVKHTGGMVGDGGTRRQVDPILFAGAPRYHSGGMVGLKPDERPAILQTGEEVLSRTDPRNRANGGLEQQAGSGYRIVNVVDPSMVEGFLQSSAGERVVLNVISRNAGQVRQTIGK